MLVGKWQQIVTAGLVSLAAAHGNRPDVQAVLLIASLVVNLVWVWT